LYPNSVGTYSEQDRLKTDLKSERVYLFEIVRNESLRFICMEIKAIDYGIIYHTSLSIAHDTDGDFRGIAFSPNFFYHKIMIKQATSQPLKLCA
jgi:hypothetical protein